MLREEVYGKERVARWLLAAASIWCPGVARAQCAPSLVATPPAIGSAAEDSARVAPMLGTCWGSWSLIRSSLTADRDSTRALSIRMVEPVLTSAWNSAIPVSMNDGAMWAGRGLSVLVGGGFEARFRQLRLVVAPQFMTAGNAPFPVLQAGNPARSDYASPFHSGVVSADLPLRFGAARYSRFLPGETSLEAVRGRLAFGVASGSQWWGPGIHNALVLSNNAAGIPRAFARTARPVSTILGDVEATWFIGMLTESPFFDTDQRNDQRALSAAAVTLRLAADTGLTIGAARAVYANAVNFGGITSHFADALIDWTNPPVSSPERNGDQISSLFARWVVPGAGLSTHGEWAIVRLPRSLRDLFVTPQASQGFTIGLEWARRVDTVGYLRLEAEATMLEQTPPTPGADVPEFYTSRGIVQGYTQLGEVIGASTGPGSSSQFLSLSYVRRAWQFGVNVGRIRWEEGAYYRSRAAFAHFGHDVSVFTGLTGRWDSRRVAVDASLTRTIRLSYLFQVIDPFWYDTAFDVKNTSLQFRITPHW